MRRVLSLSALFAALACSSAVQAVAPCDPVASSGGVTFELVGEGGQRLPTYGRRSDIWVLGHQGNRYSIRIHNQTGERVETVVSVDGLDVIDGKKASTSKRGYLVPAWGHVTVDGFRVSSAEVAAFRFGSVGESYAAQTGSARNVGVIGVAVFRERRPPPEPVYTAPPYYDHHWHGRGAESDDGPQGGSSSGAAPAPSAEKSAPSSVRRGDSARDERGLGTSFGERRYSNVQEVPFERESTHPSVAMSVRYDDSRGLRAQGIDLSCRDRDDDAWRRRTAQPFAESNGRYATPPPGW